MGNADIIKAFLKQNGGKFFCDDCLSSCTGVTNRVQVNQATRPLRGVKPYRSGEVSCSVCGKQKLCISDG